MQTKFSIIGLQLSSSVHQGDKAAQALIGEVRGCRQ